MTSDGGYAEEKIYRHGEGYVSPRDSPSWSRSSYSSERSSVTPPRSVDLTAGGRRILIKLEQESELTEENQTRDETDLSFGRQEVAMATGNIDITVGGSNPAGVCTSKQLSRWVAATAPALRTQHPKDQGT